MRLLHLLPSVDPRHGGPMEAVRQSGRHCEQLGHVVEVATLDAPDARHVADFPLPVHALGPGAGGYGYTPRLVPWLEAQASRYDGIVVNGLWQYHGYAAWHVLRRLGRPYCVYTHGMLDPWFKRAYPLKHLKKWLYWPWAEYRVLRDAAAVLYTCEEERRRARDSFWLYRAREQVVAFGTTQPPGDAAARRVAFLRRYPELKRRRLLLFLGRLHEKKGCDLLIEAYARVASADPAVHLVMAGPDGGAHAALLKRRAEALGLGARITWTGMLHGDAKWAAFHAAEVFVLPSHQENFGIAVAEALGCGLPVLISDKVNIWREIQQDGAGLVAPDTVEGTERLLRAWLTLAPPARARMRANALACFERRYTVEAMAHGLVEVLSAARRPAEGGAPSLPEGPAKRRVPQ